jgi:hypothetical protein
VTHASPNTTVIENDSPVSVRAPTPYQSSLSLYIPRSLLQPNRQTAFQPSLNDLLAMTSDRVTPTISNTVDQLATYQEDYHSTRLRALENHHISRTLSLKTVRSSSSSAISDDWGRVTDPGKSKLREGGRRRRKKKTLSVGKTAYRSPFPLDVRCARRRSLNIKAFRSREMR